MSQNQATICIQCPDGKFIIPGTLVCMSGTLKNLIEDIGDIENEPIPLPNVKSETFAKVIEYCKFHLSSEESHDGKPVMPEEEVRQWDKHFVDVDQDTLFDLILAANYLDIKGLLDLTCQTVAQQIKGKTPEEIRRQFNIKNDFTPEEEEEVRRENQWAFE